MFFILLWIFVLTFTHITFHTSTFFYMLSHLEDDKQILYIICIWWISLLSNYSVFMSVGAQHVIILYGILVNGILALELVVFIIML